MGIGKRIKEVRESLNITQKELGDMVGTTASAITNYENETSHPKEPILYALLNVLNVDANYLFQDCVNTIDTNSVATPWEMGNLIKKYRGLDDHGKRMVNFVLDEESERMREELNRMEQDKYCEDFNVRFYDLPASAGTGEPLDSEYYTYIVVPLDKWVDGTDFAARVSGDSMEPKYSNGDIVLVKECEVQVGEIGVFVVDGEGYIKKLGNGELISINPKYDNITLQNVDSIHSSGKVIGKL